MHLTRPGEVIIIAPGTLHDYATARPDQTWEFYWVHFVPRSDWTRWLQLPELWPGLHRVEVKEAASRQRMAEVFERLIQDVFSSHPLRVELALSGLEQLLLLAAGSNQSLSPFDPRLETVLKFMAQRLDANLNVGELAAKVALSPSRLAHLFKEQVGDSIVATHLKLRLRQAARLLEFTNRPINEIAAETGFQNPLYFSRQFKLYYGISPRAYRKQQIKLEAL